MSDSTAIKHGPVEAASNVSSEAPALRDELLAELCGLSSTMCAAMDACPGFVPCGHAFGVVIEGLFAAGGCDDAARLRECTDEVRARNEHVSAHRGVTAGEARLAPVSDARAALLLAAVRGVACDAYAAMLLGRMDDSVDVFLARALKALGEGAADDALISQAAEAARAARALLA